MKGNVDSGTIATEKNPRELFYTKLELSSVVPESPIRELPLFPTISRDSSATQDQEGITWRNRKGCHCKQSKCLKLYCDCFASGVFCSDCDCADCHNSENCDIRDAALANVLDRNPNAFNGKPPGSPINKLYEAAPATKLGFHSRGCKCKRTKCLKKYCECFQANALCSDNCKCINCENISEVIQPSAFDWGLNNSKLLERYEELENNYNVNTLGIISTSRDNVGINSHQSAHSSPQVYQRRRHRELPKPNESILDSLVSSMSRSPKLPYRKKRSRLGYSTTLLPNVEDICSLLLAASESATIDNAENQNRIFIKSDDDKEDNLSSESESRNVEEEIIQSNGRLIELIDAQYNNEEDSQCKTKTSDHERDIYMEQERAVLETFRDCLHKFIDIGFI